mmetsp:Transcript_66424/g.210227  ORF Transcript_66424/g.210227 Transcript_66424/m.210227 type:complete len:402 (-) Transcript_66424:166-1371(-)
MQNHNRRRGQDCSSGIVGAAMLGRPSVRAQALSACQPLWNTGIFMVSKSGKSCSLLTEALNWYTDGVPSDLNIVSTPPLPIADPRRSLNDVAVLGYLLNREFVQGSLRVGMLGGRIPGMRRVNRKENVGVFDWRHYAMMYKEGNRDVLATPARVGAVASPFNIFQYFMHFRGLSGGLANCALRLGDDTHAVDNGMCDTCRHAARRPPVMSFCRLFNGSKFSCGDVYSSERGGAAMIFDGESDKTMLANVLFVASSSIPKITAILPRFLHLREMYVVDLSCTGTGQRFLKGQRSRTVCAETKSSCDGLGGGLPASIQCHTLRAEDHHQRVTRDLKQNASDGDVIAYLAMLTMATRCQTLELQGFLHSDATYLTMQGMMSGPGCCGTRSAQHLSGSLETLPSG